MRLEIGGGDRNLGQDWVNIDLCETADIRHDLDIMPWPIEDDSVDAVYSSHCIEHVRHVIGFLNEVVRIGKLGCHVEIRCPAPFAELAMVCGHVSVLSPQAVRNMDVHFPELHWKGDKRLRLRSHHFQCSEALHDAKRDLPFLRNLDDQVIMRWIPGTAHESVFIFEVTAND